MAVPIRLKVACHACGFRMEGSAKYGKGHFVQDGIPFEFVATGKVISPEGKRRVKAEVTCVCPQCMVKNKYVI